MTCKDHFSRVAEVYLLKSKKVEKINVNLKKLLLLWGKPKILQTDNGREFMGAFH